MRGLVLVAAGVVVGTFLSQTSAAQDNSNTGLRLTHVAADKPVVRLDSAFATLISPDAELQKVKDGFGFTEGITCVQRGNSEYLLLSDMWTNQIYKLTPDGQVSLSRGQAADRDMVRPFNRSDRKGRQAHNLGRSVRR